MTIQERTQVTELRNNGLPYSKIANALQLSPNTVKSYCHRNNISTSKTEPVMSNITYCDHCGEPVAQISGRKRKRFCSDKCRTAWWNAHPEELRSRSKAVCLGCGKTIKHGNRNRKYCCRECYFGKRFGRVPAL